MRNVPTELILLQIAEGLQALVSNKDLGSTIKKAHALNEAEAQKLKEAYETISNAETIRNELKKREDSLADVAERIAKAEMLEAANADTLAGIRGHYKDIEARAKQNIADAEDNIKERGRLEKLTASLEKRLEAVKLEEQAIAAAKEDLKKRSEAMKALVA